MRLVQFFVSALAASLVVHSANGAVICPSISSTQGPDTVIFCTQDQLNTTFQDCDTFIGDIYIGYDWTGQFDLPTLVNITGTLVATGAYCSNSATNSSGESFGIAGTPGLITISATHLVNLGSLDIYNADSLQSISLPIVESINSVYIENVTSLQSISLPNLKIIDTLEIEYASSLQSVSLASLESINIMQIYGATADTELNFPALLNASQVIICGIMSINFPLLVNVGSELQIGSSSICRMIFINNLGGYGNWWGPVYPSMEINLPSLQVGNSLSLTGSVSSLSMPSLTTAGLGETLGLNIISYGNPINITLPKLASASSPIIGGNIESVYLPSFTNSYGILQFYTQTPMYLNLSNLEHSDELLINGAIKGVILSSLQSIHKIFIESNITIDCSTADAAWRRVSGSSSSNEDFSCSSLYPAKPKLSKGAKAGIAVGAFLLAVVLLLICWFLTRRVKQKKALKKAEGHQLQERSSAMDLNSIAATEVGSVQSEETAVHGREENEPAAGHGQEDNEESGTVR